MSKETILLRSFSCWRVYLHTRTQCYAARARWINLNSRLNPNLNRQADILAEYLRDFAREQEAAGKIMYSANVSSITREAGGLEFRVTVRRTHTDAEEEEPSGSCAKKMASKGGGSSSGAGDGSGEDGDEHADCTSSRSSTPSPPRRAPPSMATAVEDIVCGKLVHTGGIWRPNKPEHLMEKHGFSLALDYSELPSHGYASYAVLSTYQYSAAASAHPINTSS